MRCLAVFFSPRPEGNRDHSLLPLVEFACEEQRRDDTFSSVRQYCQCRTGVGDEKQVIRGAPQQADDGELAARRVRLRGATKEDDAYRP